MADERFRAFLEDSSSTLDEYTGRKPIHPILIAESPEQTLGIRDFFYVKERGWLFVALSDMKIAS